MTENKKISWEITKYNKEVQVNFMTDVMNTIFTGHKCLIHANEQKTEFLKSTGNKIPTDFIKTYY